jgi:hypothetical protein
VNRNLAPNSAALFSLRAPVTAKREGENRDENGAGKKAKVGQVDLYKMITGIMDHHNAKIQTQQQLMQILESFDSSIFVCSHKHNHLGLFVFQSSRVLLNYINKTFNFKTIDSVVLISFHDFLT